MDYEQAKTIVKRLQHSPLRLGFALGVYNLGGGEPFVRIDHERGPYAGQTDRIMTWEEWLAMYVMGRMQAHMLNYPTLYVSGQASKWVEDMFRLIEQAEKLQKEETK